MKRRKLRKRTAHELKKLISDINIMANNYDQFRKSQPSQITVTIKADTLWNAVFVMKLLNKEK
jgi:hypothetical protein